MDEVLADFLDDGVGDGAALLLGQLICFGCNLLYVLGDVRWLYINDAGCREKIIVYRDARRSERRDVSFEVSHV